MLGHPSLLPAQVAGDAQRQRLFPEQRVAAVAGAEAPDGVVQREMADVSALGIDIAQLVQAAGEFVAVTRAAPRRRSPMRVMIRMLMAT